MKYVSDEAAAKARAMERKFQRLPADAGVIFVSIRPRAADEGKCTEFDVMLGMSHRLGQKTGVALVEHVLAEELKEGFAINRGKYSLIVSVVRGVSGACHDESAERPSQTPS